MGVGGGGGSGARMARHAVIGTAEEAGPPPRVAARTFVNHRESSCRKFRSPAQSTWSCRPLRLVSVPRNSVDMHGTKY